jgi:isopenicillin N synthase-like dioxygenase
MESFYKKCSDVHTNILCALEVGLKLHPDTLKERCNDNCCELRLNHYPACKADELKGGVANRISAHTDFGTITLLFQDEVGGLEIEDQKNLGVYLPVKRERPTEMIVNVGDCLQRWTNDILRSASHRVQLPPGLKEGHVRDRYSVAYFGKPNRNQSVATLEYFIDKEGPQKYRDTIAWEYNQEKLTRTYLS